MFHGDVEDMQDCIHQSVITDPPFSFRGRLQAREQHIRSSEAEEGLTYLRQMRVWGRKCGVKWLSRWVGQGLGRIASHTGSGLVFPWATSADLSPALSLQPGELDQVLIDLGN